MLSRCENPNRPQFETYGAAGITVCERWHSFEAFIEDMGESPSKAHSLDRLDNDKGYSPDNCRWATNREQSLNKKKTQYFEFEGERLTLLEWSERKGLSYYALYQRLRAGWSVERALSTPATGVEKL